MRATTRCPTCSQDTLRSCRLERADAQVDECAVCGGVWFPREVVYALGSRNRTEPLPAGLAPSSVAARQYRDCPLCTFPMQRKRFGEVVLDLCMSHGVWFDPGELEVFVNWVREEAGRHLKVLPGAAASRRAAIASSILAIPPDPSRGSGWSDALDCLEPVVSLLEVVCGFLDF